MVETVGGEKLRPGAASLVLRASQTNGKVHKNQYMSTISFFFPAFSNWNTWYCGAVQYWALVRQFQRTRTEGGDALEQAPVFMMSEAHERATTQNALWDNLYWPYFCLYEKLLSTTYLSQEELFSPFGGLADVYELMRTLQICRLWWITRIWNDFKKRWELFKWHETLMWIIRNLVRWTVHQVCLLHRETV